MGVWMEKHKKRHVELEPKLGDFEVNELGKNNWTLTAFTL